MASRISADRPPSGVGFVPVLLANLLPLVGVVRFGWDPETLVVVYALEVLCSFPLAAAKALFAQRPPKTTQDGASVVDVSNELVRKRGSVTPVPWLPPIHPRTVPFASAVVGVGAWFAIFIGVVLAGTIPVGDVVTRPAVAASVAALVAGQPLDVKRDYLDGGRYEAVSPYTVIETPTRQAFFLIFVLFAPGAASGSAAVLGAFVLVKLLVEWSAFRAAHGGGGRLSRWLSGPDGTADDVDPPRTPAGEPSARVSTDRAAVLSTGAFRALAEYAPTYASWFTFVWLVTVAVFSGSESSRTLAAVSGLAVFGLFAFALAVRVGEFYLRYGPLEYRRYGDRLVAYDAWLDEPQWAASVDVLRDVEVVPDRLADRWLDTRTVAVTTGWDDDETRRYLGPVADPDALVAAFDLPVWRTDLDPLDRHLAAAAVASVAGVAVAAVVLSVSPWTSSVAPLYVVFLLPFIALVPRALWDRAYPDAD